jgi:hypothetical protein
MSGAALASGGLDLLAHDDAEIINDVRTEHISSSAEASSSSQDSQELLGEAEDAKRIPSYYGDVFVPGYVIDNRYEIKATLGCGSFGAVYECMDLWTTRYELASAAAFGKTGTTFSAIA